MLIVGVKVQCMHLVSGGVRSFGFEGFVDSIR